jgi:hypothetical protein
MVTTRRSWDRLRFLLNVSRYQRSVSPPMAAVRIEVKRQYYAIPPSNLKIQKLKQTHCAQRDTPFD